MRTIFDIKPLGFLIGVFTLSLSFTSLRGASSAGILELMLLILISLYLLKHHVLEMNQIDWQSFIPLIFLIIIVTPITVINWIQNFYGSSITTLIALIYASLIGGVAYSFNYEYRHSFGLGVGISTSLIVAYILISGELFATVARFAFLSVNPNTLSLYSICACFIISFFCPKGFVRYILILFAIFYGSIALSDSFFLAILLGLLVACMSFIERKGLLLALILASILLSSIILINFEINPITSMIDLWNQADQGGARIALLKNGIEAYSYSPIIGHGGGAFSGTYHAFGRFEAHNTYVDLLTIGGPILMLIFIIPLLAPLLYLHRNKEYLTLAFLVAIVLFSFFHFTARHPIIWSVWGLCLAIIYSNQYKTSK